MSCQSGARAWISPRWTSPGSGIRNNLPPPLVGNFLFSRPYPNPCSEGHFSCLDSPFSLSPPLEAPKRRLFCLRFHGYRRVLLTILIKTGASSFDLPFLIKFVRYLINFFRHFGGRYISSSARAENRPAHYPATTHPKVPLFTTLSQRTMFHF